MYIKRLTSMNVPFNFTTAHAKAEEKALLDSGATENFIDKQTWERMGVGKRPLVKPIKVYNVDGTENRQGEMTHFCRLRIIYNGEEDLQNFYITNLGKDRLILGYPFLHRFNPDVNWREGSLSGGQVEIQSAIFKHLDSLVTHSIIARSCATPTSCSTLTSVRASSPTGSRARLRARCRAQGRSGPARRGDRAGRMAGGADGRDRSGFHGLAARGADHVDADASEVFLPLPRPRRQAGAALPAWSPTMAADDGGAEIVAGNERVLRARLADARSSGTRTARPKLESALPQARRARVPRQLGTMADKAERLASWRPRSPIDRQAPTAGAVARSARARSWPRPISRPAWSASSPSCRASWAAITRCHDGERRRVADAIAEHYSPLGPSDRCPSAPVSVAVALADKIDTLVGFFVIGEKPTGSKDPFALRRAALGVIRLILENELRLPLRGDAAGAAFGTDWPAARCGDRRSVELLDFFAERLKVHLRERGRAARSHRRRVCRRRRGRSGAADRAASTALAAFLGSEDGVNLLDRLSPRRQHRRDRGEARTASPIAAYPMRRTSSTAGGNGACATPRRGARAVGAAALAREEFAAAMAALARLARPVDDFSRRSP